MSEKRAGRKARSMYIFLSGSARAWRQNSLVINTISCVTKLSWTIHYPRREVAKRKTKNILILPEVSVSTWKQYADTTKNCSNRAQSLISMHTQLKEAVQGSLMCATSGKCSAWLRMAVHRTALMSNGCFFPRHLHVLFMRPYRILGYMAMCIVPSHYSPKNIFKDG